MHVTLQFFGDVDVGLAPALVDVLAPVARGPRPGPTRFARLAGFPDDARARVLVALLDDGAGEILGLARRVEEASATLGVVPEGRVFRPHVTLARLARSADVGAWVHAAVPLPAAPATATELVIYRSDYTSEGHEYGALARFGFSD
jgi:2'-5' RNA ligase